MVVPRGPEPWQGTPCLAMVAKLFQKTHLQASGWAGAGTGHGRVCHSAVFRVSQQVLAQDQDKTHVLGARRGFSLGKPDMHPDLWLLSTFEHRQTSNAPAATWQELGREILSSRSRRAKDFPVPRVEPKSIYIRLSRIEQL